MEKLITNVHNKENNADGVYHDFSVFLINIESPIKRNAITVNTNELSVMN